MTEKEQAAEAAGEAMERALLRATRTVENELSRVIRTGEADLERLARMIAETLARLALDNAFQDSSAAPSPAAEMNGASFNQFATVLRGRRCAG